MLKIKDNVDLKRLEEFGFEEYKYKYFRDIENTYLTIIVEKDTRKILCCNYGYGGLKKIDKYIQYIQYIQDLIQAGLVEKVGD